MNLDAELSRLEDSIKLLSEKIKVSPRGNREEKGRGDGASPSPSSNSKKEVQV